MSSSRAAQTLENVYAAIQSGRVASVPELLKVVQTIARDENTLTVADLADLIKRDSTVLAKVISAANHLGYNPTGVKIATVFEAVHVLGFNCVRRLAMSLLLMEQAGRNTTTSGQREMAAMSLCSGLIAQVAAEQLTLVDAEQAFICAALRNFGRLVLGTVMSDEFREARERAEHEGNDEPYRAVFGLTPLELGYELLKASSLPEPILEAIHHVSPAARDAAAWGERLLAHLARFSLQMSELVLDPKLDAAAFKIASARLVRRFSGELPGLADFSADLLQRTEEQLTKIARSVGSDSSDRYGLDRLRSRVKGTALPPRPPASSARPARETPLPPPASADALEVACAMLERERDPRQVLRLALDAMRTALAPRDVIYCAVDGLRGDFCLDHGHGPLAETLRGQVLFRRQERNVFLLCHSRLENVVVRDATDPTLQPHLPAWLRGSRAPKSFVLLPVQHQGQARGVILIGWPEPQLTQISPERLTLIRKLLTFVAQTRAP